MPSKLQFYSEFAERTARQITGSYRSWTAFLATAARLYKYPYNEQLMIYAQRPNATACAEYDFWKDRMGRYVQRGSTGIALIDTSGYQPRLRYVFDVADTAPRDAARSFTLWEMPDGILPSAPSCWVPFVCRTMRSKPTPVRMWYPTFCSCKNESSRASQNRSGRSSVKMQMDFPSTITLSITRK